jgi:hypothetical protein
MPPVGAIERRHHCGCVVDCSGCDRCTARQHRYRDRNRSDRERLWIKGSRGDNYREEKGEHIGLTQRNRGAR